MMQVQLSVARPTVDRRYQSTCHCQLS